MRIEDPWSGIKPPEKASISAQRVEQETPWGLYWAVDADRNRLLILQHGSDTRKSHRLPELRGLRVEEQTVDDGPSKRIIIRLTDWEQKEIFLRFCLDIVEATALANNEEQAVERFVARIWRWHRLLGRGRRSRLSDEQQKGLIGELVVLERHLFPVLGTLDAVKSWTGPLGAHQDFQISRTFVEAKAQGAETPHVTISSEHQLASGEGDTLFLHVTAVLTATEDTSDAFTVTEFANRVRSLIAKSDMSAVELFEERLALIGFEWTDDYSDKLWLSGREAIYEVREGFPRIMATMVPGGVNAVRYRIALVDCEEFRVDSAVLASAIGPKEETDDT